MHAVTRDVVNRPWYMHAITCYVIKCVFGLVFANPNVLLGGRNDIVGLPLRSPFGLANTNPNTR